MRHVVRLAFGGRGRVGVGLVVAIACWAVLMATASVASASTTIAKFVYSPEAIGSPATVPPSHFVAVSLSIEDSTGTLIPHATVYMSFVQASGGGTASVSGFSLTPKAQPEVADATGHITINYTTPPSFPSTGCDFIHTQDQPKFKLSHVKKDDPFCFSSISSIGFTPKPIAPKHHLTANSHVTITVSVFRAGGTADANTTVWISFRAATGGGTATVNGTVLTKTPAAFTTNSVGEVFIAYSTASVMPPLGTDRLVAADAPKGPAVTAVDEYRYA